MQSLKNDLGLYYNELLDVGVPKKFIEQVEFRMREFQNAVKKNTPTLAEVTTYKLSGVGRIFKNSSKFKNYESKIQQLNQIFASLYKYMEGAKTWFRGCKGVKVLEKNSNIICKQYAHFQKLGYLPKTLENCAGFDGRPYTLSFVGNGLTHKIALPDAKDINIKLDSFSDSILYRQRCLLLFSYLRQIFSTYLTMINDSYEKKLQTVLQGFRDGTLNSFKYKQQKLDKSINNYEQCIKAIQTFVEKHKNYYDLGSNKKIIKDNFNAINNQLKIIKIEIEQNKRKILDMEFIRIGTDDELTYKNFKDILKTINDSLNDMSTNICVGNYKNDDELKKSYDEIITLYSKLSQTVEDFNRISIDENKRFFDKLEILESSLQSFMLNVDKKLQSIESFSNEFSKHYKTLEYDISKNVVKNTMRTILLILGQLVHMGNTFASIYDMYDKTLMHAVDGSSIPKIKI